jgi:hypothetical protein
MKMKLENLLKKRITIKGRVVRLLPVLVLVMVITGASAALVLMYILNIDTSGGTVEANPFLLKLYEADGVTPTSNIAFPSVVQADPAKFSAYYVLKLVNPTQLAYVNWSFSSALPTGLESHCYFEDSSEWVMDAVVAMGDGNPDYVNFTFSLYADGTSTPGSSMTGIGIAFKSFDNPIFTASVDSIDTGGSPPGFVLLDAPSGVQVTSWSWGDVLEGGPTVWSSSMYIENSDSATFNIDWDMTTIPSGVHVYGEYFDGATWQTWNAGDLYMGFASDSLEVRFGISADAGADVTSPLSLSFVLTYAYA